MELVSYSTTTMCQVDKIEHLIQAKTTFRTHDKVSIVLDEVVVIGEDPSEMYFDLNLYGASGGFVKWFKYRIAPA